MLGVPQKGGGAQEPKIFSVSSREIFRVIRWLVVISWFMQLVCVVLINECISHT